MSNIALSAGVRSNLQSLRGTADLLSQAQGRLATGKKVNSALDNPLNFFTAKGLNSKAGGLNSLMDGMSNGIQTIKAADKAYESISKSLSTLKGIIAQAKADAGEIKNSLTGSATVSYSTEVFGAGFTGTDEVLTLTPQPAVAGDPTPDPVAIDLAGVSTAGQLVDAINTQGEGRFTASLNNGNIQIASTDNEAFQATIAGTAAAGFGTGTGITMASNSVQSGTYDQKKLASYQAQFNEVLVSINQSAKDAGFNGVNLLSSSGQLKVNFSEDGTSSTTLQGQDANAKALGLDTLIAAGAKLAPSDFAAQEKIVNDAIDTIEMRQTELGNKLSVIQNRQEFSKGLVDVLQVGAGNLVNADQNEEAANILALQTRQQLSQTALSLATQADQAVLRLF